MSGDTGAGDDRSSECGEILADAASEVQLNGYKPRLLMVRVGEFELFVPQAGSECPTRTKKINGCYSGPRFLQRPYQMCRSS